MLPTRRRRSSVQGFPRRDGGALRAIIEPVKGVEDVCRRTQGTALGLGRPRGGAAGRPPRGLVTVLGVAAERAHAGYSARVNNGTLTLTGNGASDQLALRLQRATRRRGRARPHDRRARPRRRIGCPPAAAQAPSAATTTVTTLDASRRPGLWQRSPPSWCDELGRRGKSVCDLKRKTRFAAQFFPRSSGNERRAGACEPDVEWAMTRRRRS